MNENTIMQDIFLEKYQPAKRFFLGFAVVATAVIIAGFWNYHLVDGFGRDVIAGRTIGDTNLLAGSFGERGGTFGFIFAAVAGLAATFTACNCVAFAMIPGLACTSDNTDIRTTAIRTLIAFVTPVVLIGAMYGIFIGFLGPEGV